jgi:hypothetical protein
MVIGIVKSRLVAKVTANILLEILNINNHFYLQHFLLLFE